MVHHGCRSILYDWSSARYKEYWAQRRNFEARFVKDIRCVDLGIFSTHRLGQPLFLLGWAAEQYHLIRKISDAGYESAISFAALTFSSSVERFKHDFFNRCRRRQVEKLIERPVPIIKRVSKLSISLFEVGSSLKC